MQIKRASGIDNNMHSTCNMKGMHGANDIKVKEVEKTKFDESKGNKIKFNNQNETSGNVLDIRA